MHVRGPNPRKWQLHVTSKHIYKMCSQLTFFFFFGSEFAFDLTMGFTSLMITLFLVLLVSVPAILLAKEINFDKKHVANIIVTGNETIGETDDNYICATIDWFPSDTCRYNYCMLQNSSAITLVSIFKTIYIFPLIFIYIT
jgi:hypothetical protein